MKTKLTFIAALLLGVLVGGCGFALAKFKMKESVHASKEVAANYRSKCPVIGHPTQDS